MRLSLGNLLYGSCGCDFVALWVTGSPFFYVNCYTKLLLPYFCPISDVGSCLFLGTLLFGSRVGRSTLSPCRHEVAPVSGAVALRQRQQLPHFCRIVGIKRRLSRRNLLCSSGRRGSVARRCQAASVARGPAVWWRQRPPHCGLMLRRSRGNCFAAVAAAQACRLQTGPRAEAVAHGVCPSSLSGRLGRFRGFG